jgi:hypothetical protein
MKSDVSGEVTATGGRTRTGSSKSVMSKPSKSMFMMKGVKRKLLATNDVGLVVGWTNSAPSSRCNEYCHSRKVSEQVFNTRSFGRVPALPENPPSIL